MQMEGPPSPMDAHSEEASLLQFMGLKQSIFADPLHPGVDFLDIHIDWVEDMCQADTALRSRIFYDQVQAILDQLESEEHHQEAFSSMTRLCSQVPTFLSWNLFKHLLTLSQSLVGGRCSHPVSQLYLPSRVVGQLSHWFPGNPLLKAMSSSSGAEKDSCPDSRLSEEAQWMLELMEGMYQCAVVYELMEFQVLQPMSLHSFVMAYPSWMRDFRVYNEVILKLVSQTGCQSQILPYIKKYMNCMLSSLDNSASFASMINNSSCSELLQSTLPTVKMLFLPLLPVEYVGVYLTILKAQTSHDLNVQFEVERHAIILMLRVMDPKTHLCDDPWQPLSQRLAACRSSVWYIQLQLMATFALPRLALSSLLHLVCVELISRTFVSRYEMLMCSLMKRLASSLHQEDLGPWKLEEAPHCDQNTYEACIRQCLWKAINLLCFYKQSSMILSLFEPLRITSAPEPKPRDPDGDANHGHSANLLLKALLMSGLEWAPESPRMNYLMGIYCLYDRAFAEASHHISKAVTQMPTDPACLFTLAMVLLIRQSETKGHPRAYGIEAYRAAECLSQAYRQSNRTSVVSGYALALLKYQMHRFQDVRDILDDLILLRSSEVEFYYLRGLAALQLNDVRATLRDFAVCHVLLNDWLAVLGALHKTHPSGDSAAPNPSAHQPEETAVAAKIRLLHEYCCILEETQIGVATFQKMVLYGRLFKDQLGMHEEPCSDLLPEHRKTHLASDVCLEPFLLRDDFSWTNSVFKTFAPGQEASLSEARTDALFHMHIARFPSSVIRASAAPDPTSSSESISPFQSAVQDPPMIQRTRFQPRHQPLGETTHMLDVFPLHEGPSNRNSFVQTSEGEP